MCPVPVRLARVVLVCACLVPLEHAPHAHAAHARSAYARHVAALQPRIAKLGDGFTTVLEPPFVVTGDGAPEEVRHFAATTVRWAVEKLKAVYFAHDPKHILDIWLFKDDVSYRRNARLLFGEVPDTPYGYYSPTHRALVMNIATGGGTLVHEIVHPFMEANFPDVPAWFNEGLGSLYEQSAERGGRIIGLTNWRLRGLQREIARDTLPSFAALLKLSDGAFYRDRRGDNYAQARYLCLYLQRRGLLPRFFHAFRKNQHRDPTGYRTLRAVLGLRGQSATKAFERRWRKWVMSLSFA